MGGHSSRKAPDALKFEVFYVSLFAMAGDQERKRRQIDFLSLETVRQGGCLLRERWGSNKPEKTNFFTGISRVAGHYGYLGVFDKLVPKEVCAHLWPKRESLHSKIWGNGLK